MEKIIEKLNETNKEVLETIASLDIFDQILAILIIGQLGIALGTFITLLTTL